MKRKDTGKKRIHPFRKVLESASFQQRLLISVFLVILPILLVMSVIFFFLIRTSADRSIREAQTTEMEKISSQLEEMFTGSESFSREILYNHEVQSILKAAASGERYPEDSGVAYYMNNIISEQEFIQSIVLTGTSFTVFSTEQAFTDISSFRNIRKKWWYPDLEKTSAPYLWFANSADTTDNYELQNTTPQSQNLVLLTRPVYSMDDYQTLLGYLMIYLNNDYIQNIWDSCSWGETTNIMVFDKNGRLLLSNSPGASYAVTARALRKEDASVIRRTSEGLFVCSQRTLDTDNFRICMITPYKEVNDSVRLLELQTVLIFAAVIIMVLLIFRITAGNMAKPIIYLSEVMDRFHSTVPEGGNAHGFPSAGTTEDSPVNASDTAEKGDHRDIRPEELNNFMNRTDEVGRIYRSFHQLTNRLNALINEIYVKDLEKKDAELALLQSQINPHFLYNTLDSINWMALENDEEEISEMITALSDTFRLSLMKNNSSYTQFSREIEYVESYLVLQKLRFQDDLEYEIRIPDELQALYIPRFTLQPIIENGIKHGISLLEDGGKITILAEAEDCLSISVTNDGDSIDLEKMAGLLSFDPSKGEILAFEKSGYGVQNINRRIRLLCGSSYGLSYRKDSGRTTCLIRLPICRSVEEAEKLTGSLKHAQ